jgi:hypothetical protein
MRAQGKFLVNGQAAKASEPGKSVPNDPALGQGYEAAGTEWVAT